MKSSGQASLRTALRHGPILVVAMVIIASLAAISLDSSLRGKGDDAHYVVLAKSIAEGKGFRQINSPRMPMETTFPFGFPLLLAPIIKIFGVSIAALKLVPAVCTMAAVAATYWLFALSVGRVWASVLALIVASCPLVVSFSTQLRSEALSLALTTLCLALAIGCARERDGLTVRCVILALALWFALLTRTIGVVLVLAMIPYLWFEQRNKKALFLAAMIAVTAAPFLVLGQSSTPQDTNYLFRALHVEPNLEESRMLSGREMAARLAAHAWRYARDLSELLLLPFAAALHRAGLTAVAYALALAMAALVGVGIKADFRTGRRLLAMFTPLYILFLLPQPACEPRYLLPVVPMLAWFTIRGMGAVAARTQSLFLNISPTNARNGLAALLVIGGLVGGIHTAVTKPDKLMSLPEVADYKRAGTWIATNTPDDSIILCVKPFYMYLWAGRRTEGFPITARPATLESWVRYTQATHLVIDSFGWRDKRTAAFQDIAQRRPLTYRRMDVAQTSGSRPTLVYEIGPAARVGVNHGDTSVSRHCEAHRMPSGPRGPW